MKYQYQNRLTETVYYITTTVVDWIDIFTQPAYKHVIIDSLRYCQEQKRSYPVWSGINGKPYSSVSWL